MLTINDPLVSVVIPLFNKEKYVERTLRSVLQQSFSDLEVIVVDDGSTDGSAGIVKLFSDPRLQLISCDNRGVSVARNVGISVARSDYIALVDADDEWHPEFLSILWKIKINNPKGKFFATSFEVVDSDGHRTKLDFGYPKNFEMDLIEFMHCCMRLKSPIMSSAVMVYKPLIEKVGLFPVGQKRGEDLDTWVRLLLEVPVIYYNVPLAVYWYGLPSSTCVACNEVYLNDNMLLAILEDKVVNGTYQGRDKETVLDYIAWYMVGPIDRLIVSGRCAEARRYILSSLRSKRLRTRYFLAYLKSFWPSCFSYMLASIMRIIVVVKYFFSFEE